jgi:hypothetical protein
LIRRGLDLSKKNNIEKIAIPPKIVKVKWLKNARRHAKKINLFVLDMENIIKHNMVTASGKPR